MNTFEFLQLVLPSRGVYCVTVVPGAGKSYQRFTRSLARMAEIITEENASTAENRGAVYHACASYHSGRRLSANAAFVRAFWLDLDVGPDKAFASRSDAARGLAGFCRELGLPGPLVVGSGMGLHGYWPLTEDITCAEWLPYARGLKALCAEHGFAAGRERTADIASILRPPGSTHRKSGDRPVSVLHQAGASPLGAFAVWRSSGAGSAGLGDRPKPLKADASIFSTRSLQPLDLGELCRRCAQVRHLRDNPTLPEPQWFGTLGVLAFAEGGASLAHEWSAGDPRYSPEQTQKKLDAKAAVGPTTCRWFKDNFPAQCRGCPYTVSTPLDTPAVRDEVVPPPLDAGPPILVEHSFDDIEPFVYSSNGCTGLVRVQQGATTTQTIISSWVDITSVARAELRPDAYYVNLIIRDAVQQRVVPVDAGVLKSQTLGPTLATAGINVHELEPTRRLLTLAYDRAKHRKGVLTMHEQFGWKQDDTAFLAGPYLYTDGTMERTGELLGETRVRAQWLDATASGDLGQWLSLVDRSTGVGREAVGFCLLASMAAVMMKFLSSEGGAIFAATTRESGPGKSFALAVAASFWASLQRALFITEIDTVVTKSSAMAALGNLPCFMDEMQARDPERLYQFIQGFTEGRGKTRGTADGRILHSPAWSTTIVTASNQSLVDTIHSTGQTDAPAFRVLEFPLDGKNRGSFVDGDQMVRQMWRNGALAGQKFLRALTKPDVLAWVAQVLQPYGRGIVEQGGFQHEHRFWVRGLVGCGIAGMIAQRAGALPFAPARVMNWAVDHFRQMREIRFTRAPLDGAIEALARFLNTHLRETLVMPSAHRGGMDRSMPLVIPQGRVFIRREQDSGRYLIDRQAFAQWLSGRDHGISQVVAQLAGAGIIINPKRSITLTAGTELGGGVVQCMDINGRHPKLTGQLEPVANVDTAARAK